MSKNLTFANFAAAIVTVAQMNEAAQRAAHGWLQEATAGGGSTVLTLAQVSTTVKKISFIDHRSKSYRSFAGAGYVDADGNLKLRYPLSHRTEPGLHAAAAEAAFKVLVRNYPDDVRLT